MTIPRCLCVPLLVAGLVQATAAAHDAKPAAQPAASTAAPEPGSPAAAVDAFHAALQRGDREGALAALDPQAVIFESGGAEMSREEYASHHLASDMEFVRAVKTETTYRQADSAADAAWVLTRTRTTGRFRDRDINVEGAETMVLRRTGGGWRIVHIHWSSHALESE